MAPYNARCVLGQADSEARIKYARYTVCAVVPRDNLRFALQPLQVTLLIKYSAKFDLIVVLRYKFFCI